MVFMDRVLVVEDDRSVQKALTRLFESEGYNIQVAGDGPSGLAAFREQAPSVVVLDLRLPGMPGSDVCRHIKTENGSVPIIVLSAATDVTDKVLLLELGADDYVTKPFSPRELLARVRVVLRRSSRPAEGEISAFGDILINFNRMELTRGGQPVPLTAQEFKLLKFFTQHSGKVISREQLLNEVWGYEHYPTTRTVDNHILRLRQKLEKEPAEPVYFLTVHGAGYKFVP
jgi:DNA-binding response OmpR family regulator